MSSRSPIMSLLMGSEKYSDLKLVCQGHEFKVHKAIVCIQSPVIAAACDGCFQEAATGCVNIDEFDVATVKRLVEYMYTQGYNDDTENQGLESMSESCNAKLSQDIPALTQPTPLCVTKILQYHIHVNTITDYYDIPHPKQLANTKIQHVLDTSWSAAGFSEILEEVFGSNRDAALRNIMTPAAATHIEELLELKDFEALGIMSDFAIGILRNTIATYKAKLRDVESRFHNTEQENAHWERMRACGSTALIASLKILPIVLIHSPILVFVVIGVAKLTSPVILSVEALQLIPNTPSAAQSAYANIGLSK